MAHRKDLTQKHIMANLYGGVFPLCLQVGTTFFEYLGKAQGKRRMSLRSGLL